MAQTPAFAFTPVIILGAARSGTNMLRDAVCRLPGAATWPCDEINPIWRHGNLDVPHDAFGPEHARPEVRRFVRARFARQARRTGARWLVEKTCANALRPAFVDAILPEARYLHIRRDGRDVVPSAMKRWTAPLDLGYTLRKARFVPAGDLPRYAGSFLANRAARLLRRGGERRLRTWGPRFPGMEEVAREASLAELCARQWRACEDAARAQLAEIPGERVHALRYEAFVADPLAGMQAIRAFLGADWSDEDLAEAVRDVRADSVGRGRRQLEPAQVAAMEPYLEAPAGEG